MSSKAIRLSCGPSELIRYRAGKRALDKRNAKEKAALPKDRQSPTKKKQKSYTTSTTTTTTNPILSEQHLRTTLRQYYGYETFRDSQLIAIQKALSGQDVCIFWPTGHGKSLIYQMPAIATGKTVIVVSPLISLMQDQVQADNEHT